MGKYAVFLRGINIGGKNIIGMDDLKSALSAEHFKNIESYGNSGNIVFDYKGKKEEAEKSVKEIIFSQFKMTINMIIKTRKEMDFIIENEPFGKNENDNSKKIIIMLSEKVSGEKALSLKDDKRIEENFYHNGNLLYIYYHNGAGRSKFTISYIEKKLNADATGRNWNTLVRVSEIMKE